MRPLAKLLPTPNVPFVFFHQRKCGGSTLRQLTSRGARAHHLPAFIPCLNTPCVPFAEVPISQRHKAVYASHFNWVHITNMMYFKSNGNHDWDHPIHTPYPCMVNIREPISRVQSCWSYRMTSELSADPSEFSSQLRDGRSRFNEGCNNEPLRTMWSGGTDENQVNTLTVDSRTALDALSDTLTHVSRCLIVDLSRCAESRRLARAYLPWMNFSCHVHANAQHRHWNLTDARLLAIVREQNALEIMVYDYATKLFNAQMDTFVGRTSSPTQRPTSSSPPHIPPTNQSPSSGISPE